MEREALKMQVATLKTVQLEKLQVHQTLSPHSSIHKYKHT